MSSKRVQPISLKTNQSDNSISKLVVSNAGANGRSKRSIFEEKNEKDKLGKKKNLTKNKEIIRNILDSKIWTIVVTVATIFALVGDDIRIAATPPSADDFFFTISFISLILFGIELGTNCYVKEKYVGGFYFWLDLAATVSLIPDIGWMWDVFIESFGEDDGSSTALKAGRASRAGTKAGRIVRIVRLVRMVRIVKLYKMSKGDHDEALEQQIKSEPSKVGKKMSEMTTRRVIIIVLSLVLLIPLFDGGLDDSMNEFQQNGLRQLNIYSQHQRNETFLKDQVQNYVRNSGRLIYMKVENMNPDDLFTYIENTEIFDVDNDWSYDIFLKSEDAVKRKYRKTEYIKVQEIACHDLQNGYQAIASDCYSVAYFDNTPVTTYSAGMNILKTFFIMVVLGISAVAFSKIAETLVITPIERMMNLITQLAENPLASTTRSVFDDDEDKIAKEKGYETALLENTLIKIGALMQVGFGAAGADIIGKNMGSGDLDPMLPGKKITAIYGFCDIRKFTDTTECLQEEVMVYVNKLGDIMHSGTHAYYGMANKNVGDAFLLSWKICDGELPGFANFDDNPDESLRNHVNANVKCPPNSGAGKVYRRITPTEMADSALTAFIKCLIDLDNANTKGSLTCYLSNERVVKRFGKDFRIKMGFGMHVGWAIEGAIGSRFKIDATYISPHAEMADRLEAGSKIFMTPLNLSHWFVALLSPEARVNLRLIDRVEVRGVSRPFGIYTFDVENMIKDFGIPKFNERKEQQPVSFLANPKYKEIQEGLHPGFLETFRGAVDHYIKGDFQKAYDGLLVAQELRKNDGPSGTLLEYIKSQNLKAPENWKGYRYLDEF